MRAYKLDKKLILFTFIVFLALCLFLFFKYESTVKEAPRKATFVKNTKEIDLYYE